MAIGYACGLRTDGTVECWGDTGFSTGGFAGGFAGVPAGRFTDLFTAERLPVWVASRWVRCLLGRHPKVRRVSRCFDRGGSLLYRQAPTTHAG